MQTFGKKVFDYYQKIQLPGNLPTGVGTLNPFRETDVQRILTKFYETYFADNKKRTCLIGINPGRFGGGVTGIPFTDPVLLKAELGIDNAFEQRQELSSRFVHKVIKAIGGPKVFYENFYITSVCPIGFTKDGKNLNYYDIKELQDNLEQYMVKELKKQILFGVKPIAYSIGMGKNIKYLKYLNKKHELFDDIIALPHPRWVMQYRLKRVDEFINEYVEKLKPLITQ